MAEHSWILEHLETYLAGGLEPDERARLEEHVASCEPCRRALEEARILDRSLDGLFEQVRPSPELEDKMVQAVRAARSRRFFSVPWLLPIGSGIAALVMLGIVGSFTLHFLTHDGMGARASFIFPQSEGHVDVFRPVKETERLGEVAAVNGSAKDELRDVESLAKSLRDEVKSRFQITTAGRDDAEAKLALPKTTPPPAVTDSLSRLSAIADQPQAAQAGVPGSTPPVSLGREWSYRSAGGPTAGGQPGAAGMAPPASGSATYGYSAAGGAQPYYQYKNLDQNVAGKPVSTAPAQPGPAGGFGGAPALGMTVPAEGKDKDGKEYFSGKQYFSPAEVFERPPAKMGGVKIVGNEVTKENVLRKELKDSEAGQRGRTENKGEGFGRGVAAGMQPARQPAEPATNTEKAVPPASRRIIRSGDIEFEIDSFDEATATITQLVGAIPGGFIATVNSEKLPNGKVRGSVVVRVPPERLDALLLDLRKQLGKRGELKGQRIGSQDITKQYTDLESRLKAARAMEERLIQIIKTGKGEIKDLVVAEKELGNWRTKIEEIEGELRYYSNLVALSTLTITLTEKEIRAAVGIVEIERVQMGIEVEDVEKAQREALAAVAEAKGQITKAELKQHSAGQYSALLHFSATPEKAGPLRDRLKQLGTVARLDVDRTQQAEGGTGKPADGKVTRQDVQFIVSLYNLANIAPRETVHLQVAAPDAEAAYKLVLEQVRKALGRVVTSDLNRQRNDQTKGVVHFEVKTAEADAVLAALKEVGEVMSLQVTENPDTQNVTRAKRGFQVQIWSLSSVAPRETDTLQLATRDVPAGYRALQQAITQAKGRILNAQLNEQDRQNITAQLDFEVRRSEEAAIETALAAQGDVYSRTVARAAETEITVDSKVRFQVRLLNAASLPPRETFKVAVEVREVDQTAAAFTAYVAEAKGRVVQSQVAHVGDGKVIANLVYDVPLATAAGLVEKFKAAGIVRRLDAQRNTQVPDSKLAIARLDVALSNAELIVAADDGVWPQIRTALQVSFKGIAWSLALVIIGLCVVLPWAVLLYGGYVLALRLRRRPAT